MKWNGRIMRETSLIRRINAMSGMVNGPLPCFARLHARVRHVLNHSMIRRKYGSLQGRYFWLIMSEEFL